METKGTQSPGGTISEFKQSLGESKYKKKLNTYPNSFQKILKEK